MTANEIGVLNLFLQYIDMKHLGLCLLLVGLAAVSQSSTPAYICDVPNCQTCSYLGVCGLCENNYLLMINSTSSQTYCGAITCDVTNCLTCYQDNVCTVCADGYSVSSTGACELTTESTVTDCTGHCSYCKSSTQCGLCHYDHNLQNGECFPNNGFLVDECHYHFSGYMCQVCHDNWIVNIAFQCVQAPGFTCNIDNCTTCSAADTCTACTNGFYVDDGACVEYECDIDNCHYCSDNSTCQTCASNYLLLNNTCIWQSYACNVENCVTCSYAPEYCIQCMAGYMPSTPNPMGSQNYAGSMCVAYTQPLVTNCLTLGTVIFGTSSLEVGCLTCKQNFLNVGGYCVANLTQSEYVCNIENCVFCSQNNMCAKCADGYTVFMGTTSYCRKNYSPIPNCLLTPLFGAVCQACAEGYVLFEFSCIQINTEISCQVPGCLSCLESGECNECREGFNQNEDGSCSAVCGDENCFTCDENANDTCKACNIGYSLNSNGTCTDASQLTADCPESVTNCNECNSIGQCTECDANYTLNDGTCCSTPNQNVAYCAEYESVCSNHCTKCQKGTFPLTLVQGETQCLHFPCQIANCSYCYMSSTCLVCNQGYTLQDSKCTQYTECDIPNCVSCNSNGTCATCLNGYVPYEGSCVCNFQNCLTCQGSEFCTTCAFPTTATLVGSSGCTPEIIPATLCNVNNCQECQAVNMCSMCFPGFTLQANGSCVQNVCDRSTNCELCSDNQDICWTCLPGYIQENLFSRNCVAVSASYSCEVEGCAVCESSTVCETCNPFYNLNRGSCDPISCIEHCALCYETNGCTVCDFTYYLTTDNTCAPINSTIPDCSDIDPNCIACVSRTGDEGQTINVCESCYFGLMPNSDGSSCEPQTCTINNCQLCTHIDVPQYSDVEICLACEQNYFLNSYRQCVAYSPALDTVSCDGIYNCLYCSSADYCAYCLPSWNVTNGLCVTSLFCNVENCEYCSSPSLCVTCDANYTTTSLGACTPQCNITNCTTCSSTTECGACATSFQLSDNNTACSCPETYELINGSCSCPSGTTEYQSACYECSIDNCKVCSSNNTCNECDDTTFDLDNNTCTCPNNLVVSDSTCTCQSGSVLNPDDNTCYPCDVDNCLYCSTNNTCEECEATFATVDNNTCNCPDTYELNSTSGQCNCPEDTLPNIDDNDACVLCTIQYCYYCTSNNSCATCTSNLVLNNNTCGCADDQSLYEGTCYSCNVDNCVSCSGTDYCMTCEDTYEASSGLCVCPSVTTEYNNTCVDCDISYCTQCKTANTCDSCATWYTLLGNGCLPCDISNCTSCSSPNYCSACSNGLSVSSSGDTCLTCNIDNCVSCSRNNYCSSCESGYQLTSTHRYCITCNVPGCAWCSSNNVCQSCHTGYVLNSDDNTCGVCSYPCATCSSNGGCLSCQYPYSSTPNDGKCYTCNVANCATCASGTPSTCTNCMTGYALQDNTCVSSSACDSNCAECIQNSTCNKCIGGYTVSPTNSTACLQCQVSKCLTCSPTDVTTCRECASGYYVEDGLCVSCPFSNCETCTSSACLTFKASLGQIALNIEGTIVAATCDSNCLICSSNNPNYCLTCKTGYARNSKGFCLDCDPSCKSCSATSLSTCLSCYGNVVLSGGTCNTCNANSDCLTCSSSNTTQCTSCPNGKFLNTTTNVCTGSCPNACVTCSSSSVCTSCASGYSLTTGGQCLPCLGNCRICSGNQQGICLGCGNGFYLNGNTCTSCPEFCDSCSSSSSCLTCMVGYTLNSSQQCVKNCEWPCATCTDPTSASSCTSCLAGYSLSEGSGVCNPTTTCDGGVCYVCPIGAVLNENSCVNCTLSHCARCDPTSPSTCFSCKTGFYLKTTTSEGTTTSNCTECPTGCSTCSSLKNCLTCSSGYTLQSSLVSGASGTCAQCVAPCATCTGNTQTCTSCISGFTLKGWQCVSTFNYEFVVSLNTNLTAFYAVYGTFLEAITAPLQSTNIKFINVDSIVSGSVNVTGRVSTRQSSNSDAAGNEYYGIQDQFNTGEIAGLPILSYSLQAEGGEVPDQSSSNNLAIILGICIPVGIILIGVIIYFCFIRNKNNSPPVDYQANANGNTSTVRQTFELTRDEPNL